MSRGLPTPGYNLVPTFGPKPGTYIYSEDFIVVAWESGSCKVAGWEPCANVWAFQQCSFGSVHL